MLAALVLQSILVVPTQYPDPQAAVDAASAGDLVWIQGGSFENGLRIDKPISIHAEPRAHLERYVTPGVAIIEIQVPGSQNVVLSGLDVGTRQLLSFESYEYVRPAVKTLGATRLDRLLVVDCRLQAPRYGSVTGQTSGDPGVHVRAKLLDIRNSFIMASDSTFYDGQVWAFKGYPGAWNALGDVVVVGHGSWIEGAFRDASIPSHDNEIPDGLDRETAPGIRAAGTVFWLEGVVKAGRPGPIYNTNDLGKLGFLEEGPPVQGKAPLLTTL